MFKKILFLLVIATVALVGFASTRPDDFRISRSIRINAQPATIFPYINNLSKFNTWNPWADLDPNSTVTMEGPEEGVGNSMSWAGNYKVGKGSMTNVESVPDSRVVFDMVFVEPMAGNSTAEFTLTPEGDATQVSWTMSGKRNLLQKVIGVVMNCDKMVGEQFEKGLEGLKKVVGAE
jgi:uncharacterized protein YndB with AHSA1/START domain